MTITTRVITSANAREEIWHIWGTLTFGECRNLNGMNLNNDARILIEKDREREKVTMIIIISFRTPTKQFKVDERIESLGMRDH